MLVCNVVSRPRHVTIAADIVEAGAALDVADYATLFGTLVDSPGNATDTVNAVVGQLMVEAASAAATVTAAMAYRITLLEDTTAVDNLAVIAPRVVTATMAEAATAIATQDVAAAGDPYWTNVKLLMGFDGVDASTGAPGMADESSAAHGTATVRGTSKITTARSLFGGSSLSAAGGGIGYPNHADWNISNQPFTIEFRLWLVGSGFLFGKWDASAPSQNGWVLWTSGGTIAFTTSTTGSDVINTIIGPVLTASVWNAVCLDFDGTKYRLYINGAMVGSSTSVVNCFNSTLGLGIGAGSNGSNAATANIDELRFTKGVARYASDGGYTVPTATFPRH